MAIALADGILLQGLSARFGGSVERTSEAIRVVRVAPVTVAGEGDLAPVFSAKHISSAAKAAGRGASLLVSSALADDPRIKRLVPVWLHSHPEWAMADLLESLAHATEHPPMVGEGSTLGQHAVLGPRVVLGKRVSIGAHTVIGHPGFGWAFGPSASVRPIPQLGGVVIEDDVVIGPLCTIDAGTLSPTRIRRGAKLDAHVHVGHNCDIGEGTIIAAQSGFAGSVTVGRGVLVGGQVGVADHVVIGDRAKIAAKSGVIGDVAPEAVVCGYPAVNRARWLRGLAWLYRSIDSPRSSSAAPESKP